MWLRSFSELKAGVGGLMDAIVLVVEDETLIGLDIADCLAEAGFDTLEAANADQAIRTLENRPDIRLVLTDVNMPGNMNGLELAALVRLRWPPVKIIVISGRFVLNERDLPEGARFISKPYDRPRIARMVKEMMHAPKETR